MKIKPKILLVVGDDKLSRKLVSELGGQKLFVVVDCMSTNLFRLLKLLRRGSLKISWLIKLIISEWIRTDYEINEFPRVKSNNDLCKLVTELEIDIIYLYRAGLIINKSILGLGVPVFNIHCAKIPEYGGICSVIRALEDKEYNQEATLHRITNRIDDGEIISTVPYKIDKCLSYHQNEEIAFGAGRVLLLSELLSLLEND